MTFVRHDGGGLASLDARWAGHRGRDWFAIALARPAPRRGLLVVTTLVAFLVFVLGVGNRFTSSPLFIYIPEVNLIPPLGSAAWSVARSLLRSSLSRLPAGPRSTAAMRRRSASVPRPPCGRPRRNASEPSIPSR